MKFVRDLASLDWIFHDVIGSSPHVLGTPFCIYDVCSEVPSWIYMIFYQEKFDPFTFIYKT